VTTLRGNITREALSSRRKFRRVEPDDLGSSPPADPEVALDEKAPPPELLNANKAHQTEAKAQLAKEKCPTIKFERT